MVKVDTKLSSSSCQMCVRGETSWSEMSGIETSRSKKCGGAILPAPKCHGAERPGPIC